jgi:3-oxoacyl-(acyl-carrier-protein) synthase
VSRQPIAVTGIGIVSALGWTPGETWSAIEEERSGLGELTLFPSERCGHLPVAEVKGDPAGRSGLAHGSRNDHIAVFAAREAFRDAGLDVLNPDEKAGIGAILGASTGGMLDSEVFLEQIIKSGRLDMKLLRHHECASSANAIAEELGLGGYRSTVSNACSSGAAAISIACDVLESGEASVMLAGGVDSLTRLTLNGFASLLIVAPDGCRPFDANRAGMSLGEGAAVMVLETRDRAIARGAQVYAWITGWSSTCDAFHATAPSKDGLGIYQAMSLALKQADIDPGRVNYVNAHGTGTRENDPAEAKAIARLFGDNIPFVSSTKRFFGHTLAAAGAVEAVVCILAIKQGKVPANLGLREVDAEVGFEPVRTTSPAALDVVVSNSVGFGGNNCTLVICGSEHSGKNRT